MTEVLDQAKTVAYTTVGVNLLVTDAIVGRKVPAPEFAEEHAVKARKEGKKALKKLRARTEPRAVEFEARFPDPVAERMADGRTRAWDWVGIAAPKAKAGKKQAKKAVKTMTDVAAEQATDLREAVGA
jgi:hypothetical protein